MFSRPLGGADVPDMEKKKRAQHLPPSLKETRLIAPSTPLITSPDYGPQHSPLGSNSIESSPHSNVSSPKLGMGQQYGGVGRAEHLSVAPPPDKTQELKIITAKSPLKE